MILLVLLAGTTLVAQEKELILARNGQACADIVVSAKEPGYSGFAAQELKYYLDKITGGNFEITSNPHKAVRIYVGESEEAKKVGLNAENLKKGGFIIKSKENNVFIFAKDNPAIKKVDLFFLFYYEIHRGIVFGVYDFLENLGVRWPAPGPGNEFVPHKPNLKIKEELRKEEPFFASRGCSYFWEIFSLPDAWKYCKSKNDAYLWGLRMKLAERSGPVSAFHSEERLRLKALWWPQHPECFALIGNKRNPAYSCWTEPLVLDMWKKAADAYFAGLKPAAAGLVGITPYLDNRPFPFNSWPFPFTNPNEFMIDTMDHTENCDGRCRCTRCNEFREQYPCKDDSEILWKVISQVAESVKDKYPGKFVTTLVYPPKREIPKHINIPSNVMINLCIRGPISLLTPREMQAEQDMIKGWNRVLKRKPPVWGYQIETAHGKKVPGMPETYPHLIAKFLKLYRDDIEGMHFCQVAENRTSCNLDMYIAAKLLWNPNLDVEQVLDDYFKVYYGPGADGAKKFFALLENNWEKYWQLAAPVTSNAKDRDTLGVAHMDAVEKLRNIAWTQVYTPAEVKKVEAILAEMEKATAKSPVHRDRVKLLREWIVAYIEMEREIALQDKEKILRDITVNVPNLNTPPTADSWSAYPAYKLIPITGRTQRRLVAGGEFQFLRSGKILYIRTKLEEPKLAASKTPGPTLYNDNGFLLKFYSSPQEWSWNFVINDHGKCSVRKYYFNGNDSGWLTIEDFTVKVKTVPGGWEAVAAIPLKYFDANSELRFNLLRFRRIKGDTDEYSSWSPLHRYGEGFNPNNLGKLILDNANGGS